MYYYLTTDPKARKPMHYQLKPWVKMTLSCLCQLLIPSNTLSVCYWLLPVQYHSEQTKDPTAAQPPLDPLIAQSTKIWMNLDSEEQHPFNSQCQNCKIKSFMSIL
jgi:hypothetical protein